jgi:fused-like protein
VHRDIKLQNILVGMDGNVKISMCIISFFLGDFGFCKECKTTLNSIKGTPIYMAPELVHIPYSNIQVKEESYNHKVDLWSLGIILYELYNGTPPYHTTNIFELVSMVLNDPVPYLTSVPAEFQDLLGCLLEKDPQLRIGWPDLALHPFIDVEEEGTFDEGIISDDESVVVQRLDSGVAVGWEKVDETLKEARFVFE